MIEAIAPLNRSEASTVLAQAAQLVLSSPQGELSAAVSHLSGADLPGKVVSELRERVARRVQSADELILRMTEELSREMSELALGGANLDEIRDRIGQKGALPAGMYNTVFTPYFTRQRALFAVKPAYVLRAIANANASEHLNPKVLPQALTVSLFLHTPRIQGSPYTLLVKSGRVGATLNVDDVIYLFHDSFDFTAENTPSAMLTRFLEKFGIPVGFSDQFGNPLWNAIVTFPEEGRVVIANARGEGRVVLTGTPNDQIEIILACSYDTQQYARYLVEHGIPSRPVGNTTSIGTVLA